MSYSDRPQPGAGSCVPPWGRFTRWEPGPFLNELLASKPLRVAVVVLSFIWWWPVGLATLFFMIWSKRMGCWSNGQRAFREGGFRRGGESRWGRGGQPESGNRAFDEYRAETLRRLEEEQRDFVGFLDRLRYAKDKAEFDQFLAERRQRAEHPPEHPDQPQPA